MLQESRPGTVIQFEITKVSFSVEIQLFLFVFPTAQALIRNIIGSSVGNALLCWRSLVRGSPVPISICRLHLQLHQSTPTGKWVPSEKLGGGVRR